MSETHSSNDASRSHKRFGSRSLSRTMLSQDVDMINRYARKYSTTYKQSPYSALQQTGYGSSNKSNSTKPITNTNNISNNKNNNNIDDTSSTISSASNYSSRSKHHAKRPSNLISTNNHGLWNENAISNQQGDMESAMQNMIATYQTKLEKQAHLIDEIETEASKNPNFAKLEKADDWTIQEVCHWLHTIHLEKYIQNFSDQIIDGSILLRDLDENILITELGVKRIHVKKILREIEKLRQLSPKISKNNNQSKDALVESLKMEISSLHRENKHLRDQLNKFTQQHVQNPYNNSINNNNDNRSRTGSAYSNNNLNLNNNNSNSNVNSSAKSSFSSLNSSNSTSTSIYSTPMSSHSTHNYGNVPRSYKKY